MQNAALVQKRFSKQFHHYDAHATVQKDMAHELVSILQEKWNGEIVDILEIGCGTGFVTKLIKDNFHINRYTGNDIVPEAESTINRIFSDSSIKSKFINSDANYIELTDYEPDIIISGATIQWFENLPSFFNNISRIIKPEGLFAFSTFGIKNFIQIAELTGIGLKYYTENAIKMMLAEEFDILYSNDYCTNLYFESGKAVLQHIKKTGVNSITPAMWTRKSLETFNKSYIEKFQSDNGVPLTYNPQIFIAKKK